MKYALGFQSGKHGVSWNPARFSLTPMTLRRVVNQIHLASRCR